MATIGYPLTAPESGWKRYDNYNNPEIEWPGFTLSTSYTPDWDKTIFIARPRQEDTVAYIRFNFTGSKLRLISRFDSSASSKIKIIIDGKESLFSQEAASRIDQALCFEIVDLESTEHSVIIQPAELSKTVTLDAIDIDVNGGLKPYNPIESEPNIPIPINLVAVADDSQVTLSWDAVAGATGYNVKRSTTAGGPYTTIASNVAGTSYVDTDVINGTTITM